MAQATNEQWNVITKQFVEYCKEKSCSNKKEVKKVIKEYLTEQYKGKVPAARIKMFTDDFTESVSLALGY